MRPIIICIPQGGICNRMRTIASVFELAKSYNHKPKIVILWLKYSGLNADFDTCFGPIPAKVINIGRLFSKYLPGIIHRLWRGEIIGNEGLGLRLDQVMNHNVLVHAGVKILPTSDFSIFTLPSKLQRKLNPAVDENTIGVHIRRTDNELSITKSPTFLFEQAMDAEIEKNRKTTFYLATDDASEELHFVEKYGNKIIASSKRTLDRNSREGIEDAMMDLANLSRCHLIFGSYWSSFSETSSEWGGGEYRQICLL